jgi:hypothetical protein
VHLTTPGLGHKAPFAEEVFDKINGCEASFSSEWGSLVTFGFAGCETVPLICPARSPARRPGGRLGCDL